MPGENGSKSRRLKYLFFKREDTQHQVQRLRHSGYPALIPCPHLGANVVDYFCVRQALFNRMRQPQIETRVINQNEHIRLELFNLRKHLIETLFKPLIMLENFPYAHDRGILDPVR